jgi:hypothetical protein
MICAALSQRGSRCARAQAGVRRGPRWSQRERTTSKVRHVWVVNGTACSWRAVMVSYKTTEDRGGAKPRPRPDALGSLPGGNRVSVPSVTRLWTITRICTCPTSFPRNTEARTSSRIYGWCIITATARFTAQRTPLGYVDGLSRVPGDRGAQVCGEGLIAISPPYPTKEGIEPMDVEHFPPSIAPIRSVCSRKIPWHFAGSERLSTASHRRT